MTWGEWELRRGGVLPSSAFPHLGVPSSMTAHATRAPSMVVSHSSAMRAKESAVPRRIDERRVPVRPALRFRAWRGGRATERAQPVRDERGSGRRHESCSLAPCRRRKKNKPSPPLCCFFQRQADPQSHHRRQTAAEREQLPQSSAVCALLKCAKVRCTLRVPLGASWGVIFYVKFFFLHQ